MLLPINSFKRIAKETGAKRISKKAIKSLAKLSEEYAIELAKTALEIMRASKRTTLIESDIETAFKIKKLGESSK